MVIQNRTWLSTRWLDRDWYFASFPNAPLPQQAGIPCQPTSGFAFGGYGEWPSTETGVGFIEVDRSFCFTDLVFADYLAGVMDSLGIVAHANPDAAQSMPASLPRVYMVKRDGSTQPRMIARIGSRQVKVDYPAVTYYWHDGPDTAWNPIGLNGSFAQFVTQVNSAYRQETGEQWPIQATGGFAATAWESAKGVWVYVENPMQDSLVIHAARTGSVTVRVRGLDTVPAVVDLCGYDPDPNRQADSLVSRTGEFVTFSLSWFKGDARVFYIDFTPKPLAAQPGSLTRRTSRTARSPPASRPTRRSRRSC